MTDANSNPILRAKGIHMSFGGVEVLKNVDFDVRPGEVHALVGENGAGKSTLTKIIGGIYHPKGGGIEVDGVTTVIPNPRAAIAQGIALIHQEPLLFPDLDIAENIFVGRPLMGGLPRHIQWSAMYREASRILTSLGVHEDPRTKVRGLSIATQQMVEMASALSQDARVLLMDEPTAALTPSEVADLFAIIRRLRDQGTAIVFISHRFEEIFAISDRITVLRDGEMVGVRRTNETTVDEIIRLMVGRSLNLLYGRESDHAIGVPMLEVEGLTRRKRFQDISFQVRAGEIVGLAGLVGAGRTDVAKALFGMQEIDGGTIRIAGQEISIHTPSDAMNHGMIYLPEDRQHQGLLMPMSVAVNVTLPVVGRLSRYGWLQEKAERAATMDYVQQLHIVLRDVKQPVRELSGGNQQKVVIAKWMLVKPQIMLLDEPTRGIDIGAKSEVHRLMNELAAQGIAILMISSELPEILAMSDRVLVMREGRLTGHFQRAEATAERVMAAATGQLEKV